jgi:hypothetical protein
VYVHYKTGYLQDSTVRSNLAEGVTKISMQTI